VKSVTQNMGTLNQKFKNVPQTKNQDKLLSSLYLFSYLIIYVVIFQIYVVIFDDLNGVVVSNADCQSKGPGFESRVSHGPFQKV
jgi:hypothetical protein